MVQIFRFLLQSSKKHVRAHFRSKFVDGLRINVRGGHGGNGTPKYGGVGGQGGCVYLTAKEGVTLSKLSKNLKEKRVCASSGEDSSKTRVLGRPGVDECIEVPLGVQVLDDNGKMLADLNQENTKCIVAGGGMGGCVRSNFIGKPGENRMIQLDLKIIADVGLVGFPNAGKSTFLKAVSNAKPKIASYPFTTIRPQIGTIDYPDLRAITVADLPGLIEGAHANFGMGHKFLKHVERTRLLLFMVDIFGFRLSVKHPERDCLYTIYALNKEIEMYDSSLLSKPCVLLLNKMDKPGASDIYAKIKPTLKSLEAGLEQCPENARPRNLVSFEKILPISAINSARTNQAKEDLRGILDQFAEKENLTDIEEIKEQLRHKINERGPKLT